MVGLHGQGRVSSLHHAPRRADFEELRQDSVLDATQRASVIRRLEGHLVRLGRRIEETERAVAAIPEGNPLAPNLVHLNPDSLARALAIQWILTMRQMGLQMRPP